MKDLPEVILLCGFSGSGKTETGEKLSTLLEYGFTDTDATVEEVMGKSISEIFLKLGEAKFRFAESDVLRMAMKRRPQVISLGGGTIADDNSLAFIKDGGFLIYLKVGPETIFERIRKSHVRPMLQSFSKDIDDQKDIVMQRINDLLADREKYYLKADMVIDTEGKSTEAVAAEIEANLRSDA